MEPRGYDLEREAETLLREIEEKARLIVALKREIAVLAMRLGEVSWAIDEA